MAFPERPEAKVDKLINELQDKEKNIGKIFSNEATL